MFQPICKGKERVIGGADNQIPNPQPSDVAMQLTANGSAPSNPVVQDQNKSTDNGNSDQGLKAELEKLLKVILLLLEGLLLMIFFVDPSQRRSMDLYQSKLNHSSCTYQDTH